MQIKYGVQIYQRFFLFSFCYAWKTNAGVYLQRQEGEISLSLQTLHDEAELIAQGLVAVRHADLGHVGLTDVVAFWTFLQIVFAQEVDFFLEHRIKPTPLKKINVYLNFQSYIVVLFLQ